MSARIYVAAVTFWYHGDDDMPHLVHAGDRYREGHPALEGRLEHFKEDDSLDVHEAPVAQMKRSPGRPRKD